MGKIRIMKINTIFIYIVYIYIPPNFTDSLGPEYGEACILDLEKTWEESEPQTPLVCILSIGSDPSPQITALAKSKDIRNA